MSQSKAATRTAMPMVAAWVDDLRAAFGADVIDGQIRAATRDGLPTFYASEGGLTVGVPLPAGGRAISAADMVILKPKEKEPNEARR